MTNIEGVLDKDEKLIEEVTSSEILQMIKDETITLETIDTNRDGNLSISEINSFKRQSTSNKSDPFKIFLVLISLVLLISSSPYVINSIKNKYVSKNKQKE